MDKSELAAKMLQWEKADRYLKSLTETIEKAVLELEKTQTVGNVRATYSKGRKSYDYEIACAGAEISEETVNLFTSHPEPKINWKDICEHADIDNVPFNQGAPKVTIKIV